MSNTITAEHLNLAKMLQSFYRVPEYQREYVWGERGMRGDGGDEVEQFLNDIHGEYEAASANKEPPEYFIGTIVVHKGDENIYDLIDGQQRMTTVFLLLCALRDTLTALHVQPPETIAPQIFASDTDWQGDTQHRMRVILQYADARGALEKYGRGEWDSIDPDGTRTIRNLYNAYTTICTFLDRKFGNNAEQFKRFYGYLVNKVTLIRIETLNVNRALKIFETINDRGVGLDAMDLLKNLLFMKVSARHFEKIKAEWDALTQALYQAREKPLRFLRYFILARYNVKEPIREDGIYDWLTGAKDQTGHETNPLSFARELRQAAQDYVRFSGGQNRSGRDEQGLRNTRAISHMFRLHYILLLAGNHLAPPLFTRLCDGIESVVCLWLLTGVQPKTYEAAIIRAAQDLRRVETEPQFNDFARKFFDEQKLIYGEAFRETLFALKLGDVSNTHVKYLLAKVTQYFDCQAFGSPQSALLSTYLVEGNEIEHILPQQASPEALEEFGEGGRDRNLIQSLGNLMLLEGSLNSIAGNKPYSRKYAVYTASQFLMPRCQKEPSSPGKNDRITRTIGRLDPAPVWDRQAIVKRQQWYANVLCEILGIPESAMPGQKTA